MTINHCLSCLLGLKSRDFASMLRLANMSGSWDLGPHLNQPKWSELRTEAQRSVSYMFWRTILKD